MKDKKLYAPCWAEEYTGAWEILGETQEDRNNNVLYTTKEKAQEVLDKHLKDKFPPDGVPKGDVYYVEEFEINK